jgi:aryl-alcohol dehydrogenase-like predicted oxidoreductase
MNVNFLSREIPKIGLGTWQFGSREWAYGPDYARREAREILLKALDLGVGFIDTAEIYGFGRSERIIGQTLEDRPNLPIIATKLFPILPIDLIVAHRANLSAKRLKTNCIDLYQLHWQNPVVPLGLTAKAFKKLLDKNVIKAAGVSNLSLASWKSFESNVGQTVISNQVQFSLLDQRPLKELVSFANSTGHFIVAYSPLAQGALSGKYDENNLPKGVRRMNKFFYPQNLIRLKPLISLVGEVAKKHSATNSQVLLAWVISHGNVIAIPGASSVAQLQQNFEAKDLELSEAEIADLTNQAAEILPKLDGIPRHLVKGPMAR